MIFYQSISVLVLAACASCQYAGYNNIPLQHNATQVRSQQPRMVTVDVYYESLCPDSIRLYTGPLVDIMLPMLAPYVNLQTYPYGKAKTVSLNGVLSFHCQHGDKECYGNKLHACAIENLQSTPSWFSYNACLMTAGSNDNGADKCAAMMQISSEPIKACAKSQRGSVLLKFYGDESKKVTYNYIPHVVVDGVPLNKTADLVAAVRAAVYNDY